MARLQDYFKYNSYFSLLSKEKLKELYWGHTAQISMFCVVLIDVIVYLLIYVYKVDSEKATNLLSTLCISIAPGLIGLLGFLITGVSLLAALINEKSINILDKNGVAESFVEVLFSFYFAGSIIGVAIIFLVIDYILLQYPQEFNSRFHLVVQSITVYSCCYSIFYTIGLLGSCINTFFANISLNRLYDHEKKDNDK